MSQQTKNQTSRKLSIWRRLTPFVWRKYRQYWRGNWSHKVTAIIVVIVVVSIGSMYGIARWYIASQAGKPYELGATFIPDYAQFLGLDPQATLHAMLSDLDVRQLRLVSYWNDIEPSQGHYDFSTLDWEFAQAKAVHAKVSLAIGLRQPRWPECHAPPWVNTSAPEAQWYPALLAYMQAVIIRYQHNPALQSYQLENEYFNSFGSCTNFNRSRLVDEFQYVKKLDSIHPIFISRSNNYGGLPLGQPMPDEFGISVYRRVWTPWLRRYVEYPFPAWYYAFLAGTQKLMTGKNSVLHELQAEPWPPDGQGINQISVAEQNKSFNAQRFAQTVSFGKATGMHEIYLWGAEFWYYRRVVLHQPDLWNTAKQQFAAIQTENGRLKKN